jgi:hypothetical protein
MKVIREGVTLEVANTTVLLPGILIFVGCGFLFQELPKVLRGAGAYQRLEFRFSALREPFLCGRGAGPDLPVQRPL